MQDIDAEQLEKQVNETQDPDLLKELMGHAIRLGREDLVEAIIERSIRNNRLMEKLQDYELKPPATLSFFGDEDELEEEFFPG
jgi:hypothetical protein